jgi:molybdenum cofactor cytidylyltransferase
MGAAKLLLPWGEHTVIEATLAAWRSSQVSQIFVVTHPDDELLAEVCRRAGAEVVVAHLPPPEMKDSIQIGLEEAQRRYSPTEADVWLIAPADIPTLSQSVIDQLLAEHDSIHPKILVPTHTGRRGHPVLFPWRLAEKVALLPADLGVNRLLEQNEVVEVSSSAAALAPDLDSPEDYKRLSGNENS